VAWALAAVVVAGACSGDDDGGGDGDGGAGPAGATTSEPAATPELRIVAINQLHGLFCPPETDSCGAPSRLQMLFDAIEEAGCPDVVGLAEIGPRQQELVPDRLAELCGGRYALLWDPAAQAEPFDQEMILTTAEVLDEGYVELANLPWSGHWAKLDSALGTVDFVMVHQASSANNPPCTAEICPAICEVGVETGSCHTRELIAFMDEHGAAEGIHVVAGDLNKPPQDPRIAPYYDAGFVDAWVEAGNPECDPATGIGCTCCIDSDVEDYDGGGLRDPALRRDARIDFVMVRNRSGCDLGYEAETFAGERATRPVDGYLWPSDHAGVLAVLTCT
jgi:hypothetical protein